MINLKSSTYELPELPLIDSSWPSIERVSDRHYAVIGSTTDRASALYSVHVDQPPQMTLLKSSSALSLPSTYYSTLKPISFKRTRSVDKEELSHAMFMPPLNPNFTGPASTLPPLILHMHGGPTSHVGPGLRPGWQYWTTRGFAFAAVNHSGSTGYSRAYRTSLDGQWGIADIADAASCVDYLASAGLIDRTRVGIEGGSAGGYACLQALCWYPDVFAGGVCQYGVSDLKALIQDTHKFESRYVDRLVFGSSPAPPSSPLHLSHSEKEFILKARSPLFHAYKIKAAVLLLQGLDDEIVPPAQAQGMVDVIRARYPGRDRAKIVTFEGEGHGFVKAETVERAVLEQEMWWRRTLMSGMRKGKGKA